MQGTRMPAVACLLALSALLTGCSTSFGRDTGSSAAPPGSALPGAPSGSEAGRDGAAAGRPPNIVAAGPTAQRPPIRSTQRVVVRDATVDMRVDNPADATGRARLIASAHGGFVAAEDSDPDAVALTLRVAAADLDATLTALGELGEVTSRHLTTQDVTDETVDVAARITSQRASVERVRALLDRADTIGEVMQVESELTSRQAELESLEQRAAALSDQVALSTVRVRLTAEPKSGAAGGFGSGLTGGWDALRATGRVGLLALGAVLPFAVALAVPVGVAVLWYRRRRRSTVTTEPPRPAG